jgi:hypothetical protein
MKRSIAYILLLPITVAVFKGCVGEGTPDDVGDNVAIELSYAISEFTQNTTTRGTNAGTAAEQQIDDLYVFLFPTTGSQTLNKYYISSASFSGGAWVNADKKIVLNLSASKAGKRDVYIVANCAAIKTQLDNVNTLTDLQSVTASTATPWSKSLTPPIIMIGNQTWDFSSNPKLNEVSLIRTVAKVEVNISLPDFYQSKPTIQEGDLSTGSGTTISVYKYRFVNFDTKTYLLKPSTKPDNLSTWNGLIGAPVQPPLPIMMFRLIYLIQMAKSAISNCSPISTSETMQVRQLKSHCPTIREIIRRRSLVTTLIL